MAEPGQKSGWRKKRLEVLAKSRLEFGAKAV